MRLFTCQHCAQALQFEHQACPRCERRLGFLPGPGGVLSALEPAGGDLWRPLHGQSAPRRFCDNAAYQACNWMLEEGAAPSLCLACRHNRTIPSLDDVENLSNWRRVEVAKHRLVYTLVRLRLPMPTRDEDAVRGLAFDFLADLPQAAPIMTGHDNGLITIALKEADHAERERARANMGEPYRTVLGHFRHEVGHYYFDRLVVETGQLEAARAVFGDERADYGQALQRHYAEGPPADWQESFVSSYATAHPWEDFAETWAHYLHIVDALETAAGFGLSVSPRADRRGEMQAEVDFDPYRSESVEELVEAWTPIAFALNALNRSLGQRDLYPFTLTPTVTAKIGFVQRLVQARL